MHGIVFASIKEGNSTLASARIARFIAEYFKIPLITLDSSPNIVPKSYDYVFLVNANFGFSSDSPFLSAASRLLCKAKYPIYVMNDYVLTPPGQLIKVFRPRKLYFWSTVPEIKGINIEKTLYVNWNQLTYEPLKIKEPVLSEKCFYWGAFRRKRSEYFAKYLNSSKVTISTTSRAKKMFESACPNAHIIGPAEHLYHKIQKYGCTLYLEDNVSNHGKYCSPANRFYEALSAGVPIFFQPESVANMERAGYDVRPWVVKDGKQLKRLIPLIKEINFEKQQDWRRDYRKILIKQMEQALEETK